MRKLISLGVLTILLSMLVSPAIAGSVEDCVVLKEDGITKALHGLCIAYWGADNGRSQERILANYRKKMRTVDPGNRNVTGDPDMPGLEDAVECPCWNADKLAEASEKGTPLACGIDNVLTRIDFAIYEYGDLQYQFHADDAACFQRNPDGSGILQFYFLDPTISEEEKMACRDGIHVLVDMDFGGSCN
jgi:hypothetical protein